MAQLSKAAFLSKWSGLFADNATREISELDMRDFRLDIADSFQLISGVVTVNTAGIDITLDFNGLPDVSFIGYVSFAAAKNIVLANNSAAVFINFFFTITDVAAVLTLPNEFKMDDIRWDTFAKTWTPDNIGKFKMSAVFDGSFWNVDRISGPYF